ncbi:MAG: ABC transporter ATP-binding protein [bacterium]|jgi:lipopolysaccharide transport system ATP-binding protein|nr:ABC transporter ATP-binding protein [bacterium]
MSTVIKTSNLGKKYIIRHEQTNSYRTFREAIVDKTKGAGARVLQWLRSGKKSDNPFVEEFWALDDVSFEVEQGERIGIIGCNGAGKTTLLKLLSRITEPSSGSISLKGRVASLLEVGTGFHPELTGRENIFLNGAVLGMGKQEIRDKFDEIVAFSEVEKFLDTPVKRYSSGMYVRLAFAVAAHLEPEILLVDEVLAVGDAAFRKKCLGKIKTISGEGRTVLFVSHNMSSILQLTDRAILLEKGRVRTISKTEDVVREYSEMVSGKEFSIELRTHDENFQVEKFLFLSDQVELGFNKRLPFELTLSLKQPMNNIYLLLAFRNSLGAKLLTTKARIDSLDAGNHVLLLEVDDHRLTPGSYTLILSISVQGDVILNRDPIIGFELSASCVDEPLLLPHIARGKDKIGAFCPLIVKSRNSSDQ